MKSFKIILLVSAIINCSLLFGQNFPFIPPSQHLLTEKQLKNTEIIITPDVLLFSENGKILSPSQMTLMTNPDYKPLFYADSNGNLQSVVFVRKSKADTIVVEHTENTINTLPDSKETALDFIIHDISGNRIKLSELKGKIVVLNFWFIKCGPCVMEIPQLNQLQQSYSNNDNVVFLALTFDKEELVHQFLNSKPFNYTIVTDAMATINTYGIQSYPTNLIIDQNGKVVLKEFGYRTNIKSVLKATIDSLL